MTLTGIDSSTRNIWRWLFVFALLVYALAAIYQLNLPGVYYDEALDAVPAIQVLLHQPLQTAATVHLAGHEWPLMLMSYVGSTTTYLSMVVFALFGPSFVALRLMNVLLGLVSLLLTWGFLRDYLDERVAALSVLLLAVNPNFVFWTRMGAVLSLPMLPLAIGSLWSLYRWYQHKGDRYLVLAALLIGLGVTTKLLFVWYIIGLGAAWLLLSPFLQRQRGWRAWLWPWRMTTWRLRVTSLLAFLLGLGPLLIYNLDTWHTLEFVLDAFAGESARDNGFLAGMPEAIRRDFASFLNGSSLAGRSGIAHVDRLAVPAFLAALATLVGLALRSKLSYSVRKLALLVVLLFSLIGQSALTTMGYGADHILIAWPIPQALMAAAIFSLVDVVRGRRWQVALLGLFTLCIVASSALTTVQYHRSFAQTGGQGYFSTAIYTLADDLEKADSPRIVALDWGFARSLQLLTGGRLDILERFTYGSQPTEEEESLLEQQVVQPDLLYLVHSPRFTAFPGHRELLDRLAYRHGLTPVLWKSYSQRDGEPVIDVYSLEPTPPLSQLPDTAHSLNVSLGDSLRLLGYQLSDTAISPGDTLQMTLFWQASAPQERSYQVFTHLVDDSGRLWAQHDAAPRDWSYPTTQWQPNEIVADRIWLPISTDIPPGSYHLFVGMYNQETGERLPIQLNGQPQPGNTLGLADIVVP